MGTRFTRVTVVADSGQVDVSLPSDSPLAEQLPVLLRLLSVPTPSVPVRWALSTPERGPLSRDSSLDDVGILDGAVLHLTPAPAAALPPFVDDVESAAAADVAALAPAWAGADRGAARRGGIAGLLAVLLGVAVLRAVTVTGPVSWIAAAIVTLVALVVGGAIRERGATGAALLAAPGAAALVVGAFGGPLATPGWGLMLAIAAAGLAVTGAGLVRREPGLRTAGLAAAMLAGLATVCLRLDLQADRTAGLVLLGAVIGVGLAGQLALGGAGLVNLMMADERGDQVPRAVVTSAVRRGQAIATGAVWSCSLAAAAAAWVLVTAAGSGAPGWIGRVLGALGGLVFAVRSRTFSRARQVLPMLMAAVLAAAAVALQTPDWLSMSGTGGAALGLLLLGVVAVVLATTGLASLPEVPRARVRRVLELVESVAVLALVPVLILLFATIPAMQRWLG